MSNENATASRKPGHGCGANLVRHDRLCTVCQHREKATIELGYVRGASSYELAKEYGLSPGSIRRHAYYFSLINLRTRNVRRVLSFRFSRRLDKFLGDGAISAEAFVKVADAVAKLDGPYPECGASGTGAGADLRRFYRALIDLIRSCGPLPQRSP